MAEAPALLSALAPVAEAARPWTAALLGDGTFELLTLAWLLFFVLLRWVVVALADRNCGASPVWGEIRRRPTVVPVTLHSFVSMAVAALVIYPPGLPTDSSQPLGSWLWRRVVLPFSSGYWLFDLYFYCYNTGDVLIGLHHIIILIINFPIGDDAGHAVLNEVMPSCNLVMMSTNGYIMELTTFLLYLRWFLTNSLTEHRWVYSVNNAMLLGSWVALRLVYAPYFMIAHLWETCPITDGGFFPILGSITYMLMIVMSAIWLCQMLRNGVHAFLVLNKSSEAALKFGSQKRRPPQAELNKKH